MEYIEYIESIARLKMLDNLSLILDKNTKYHYLSASPYLRYSDVAANKTAGWYWDDLSCNPGIILQDILSHPDDPWKWTDDGFRSVGRNKGIRLDDVLQHPDMPWDWNELSANETVTMDIVMNHQEKPWNWYRLSINPGILWSDIQAHPDLPWNFWAMSQRPISNEQIIIDNFAKWDWYYLSIFARFNLIRDHPEWPWQWKGICLNSNVPLAFIPDKYRDYFSLSFNHKISIQDVLDHPKANWYWGGLSERIDFQDILRHLELPWVYYSMSQNPGLRLVYVMEHITKPWCLTLLAQNLFTDDYNDYYTQLARHHLAALKIQLYWRKYATDHRYLICHRVQLGRLS